MRRLLAFAVLLPVAASAQTYTTQVTVSSQAASTPQLIDLDHFSGFIGLICTVSGTLTYSVQVTGDPLPVGSMTHWNEHDSITSLTASANGNIAFPVTAWRVNVSSYSSGSVTCSAVKANTTYQWQYYQKGQQNP